MAGIKVPQYQIFKIGTNKLKANKWNLTITEDEAKQTGELISLFEGQEFRLIAKILNADIKMIPSIDKRKKTSFFKDYICSVVVEKESHFNEVTNNQGIIINGNIFKRFVGTTGGLKNNTLLFVNAQIIDELNRRCNCNRNIDIPLVPAKYEAYKALTCSSSQQIISPKRILVVKDCITVFKDTIISLDNSNQDTKSPSMELLENTVLENNISDGFNLCTIEFMDKVSEALGLDYITNGVCLRNAWLKGMLYPFPIIEFFDTYCNGNYIVKDIWGNKQDIRECEMILTESSLKLWFAYSSIDDYMKSYKEMGYEFAVTKISPHKLDDVRELNYQYLQSYELSDEDIKELCKPTIDYLKNAMCGDYHTTLEFLGITGNEEYNTWQKALSINPYILNDPYIIDSVHRLIKKKINDAKIGKLFVNGNYQIASGDPFALMQSICGLQVTGLLQANECYSSYWNERNVNELVIFRSPMTSHNNIRKCNVVNNDDVAFWYQYMDNIMIINSWDTFCMAENGCDYDSDILFSTNNDVLVRCHKRLPAISCAQRQTQKVIITEDAVKETNKNGMGNQVGTITNRVTAMMEVQARFSKDSAEYKELEYRIACGQLYQQDELDKIKGIIAQPMPNAWYNLRACKNDDFLVKVCADKKPYFMIYVYSDYKQQYNKYIKNSQEKSMRKYNMTIEQLYKLPEKTDEQLNFIKWYEIKMPFGISNCAMNNICRYVESQFDGYKLHLKHNSEFDYNILKVKRRCTEKHRTLLLELSNEYVERIAKYKSESKKWNEEEKKRNKYLRKEIQTEFYNTAKELCPDDNERLNIVLDMCYAYKNNKQFCWDIIGDLICKRLEELLDETEYCN